MADGGKNNPAADARMKGGGRTVLFLGGILLLTLLTYWPVFQNGFVNLDDNLYITALPRLSWPAVGRVFSTSFEGHYHPLTLLCLGVEHHFFGMNPFPYHLVNVVLHLLATLLVFFLIRRLTGHPGMGLMACTVFGLHPIHVEPVAWIASQKDLLYAVFYLLSALCYLTYTSRNHLGFYTGALIFFGLSMLSKAMAVALAPTLLAIDYAMGRSLLTRRVWLEKLPFFALALLGGITAIESQKSTGYIAAYDHLRPLGDRLLDAAYGALLYGRNLILPNRLYAHYPYPEGITPSTLLLYAGVIMGILVLFVLATRRSRLATFSLLFLTINILLMLKLVPVSDFIVADRYAYVASVGFCLLAALAAYRLLERFPLRQSLVKLLFCAYLFTLAVVSAGQCRLWHNSLVLWENVLSGYPQDPFALDMSGNARFVLGDFDGAIAAYDRALALGFRRSYINRGYARSKKGDWAGATADYEQGIALDPDSFLAYNNLAAARYELGDYAASAAAASRAVSLTSEATQASLAYNNRGRAAAAMGRSAKALADFSQSILLNPDYYTVYTNRAGERIKGGDYRGAIDDTSQAIQLDPADPLAYRIRGEARRHMKDDAGADQDMSVAEQLESRRGSR